MKKKSIYIVINIFLTFLASCSTSSNGIQILKELSNPVANDAMAVTLNSFNASWQPVEGINEYRLDVSSASSFSTFIEGYENTIVKDLQKTISNLKSNTSYYYRVRAYLDGRISSNSNTIKVTTDTESLPETALKLEATNFFVGIAVNPIRIGNTKYNEIYQREFNSITAENAMKMRSILKGIDSNGSLIYDWSQSDAIVDYAEANDMNIHGHALIWHRSIPDDLQNFNGTDEEFRALIETYITDVVSRYKGKVDSWDVVNEAIADNSTSTTFRQTLFLERMGEDYIKKCFQYARNADADVKLFYNDYNMTFDQDKQQAVFNVIDDLILDNVIDGVGYQMHINSDFPPKSSIQSATELITQRGLLVHFSELDVRTNQNNSFSQFTDTMALRQKIKVKEVVSVYNDIPNAYKYALTIWGLKDDDSWIIPEYGNMDWPLLFDNQFMKKEAYHGFVEALNN